MKGALWSARLLYWSRRIGVPGWVGLLALALALALAQWQLRPAQQRLLLLETRTAAAQQRLQQPLSAQPALTPTQQLNAFYATFAAQLTVPDVLASLHEVAVAQKLDLDIGEYSLTKEKGLRLDSLRIALPVKGNYVQLRQFAAEALRAQPALALERISIRREKVAEDGGSGRVVFVLFVEHTP